jgi:hypothetical protein
MKTLASPTRSTRYLVALLVVVLAGSVFQDSVAAMAQATQHGDAWGILAKLSPGTRLQLTFHDGSQNERAPRDSNS